MIATGPIFVKAIHANGFLVAFWRMAFALLVLTGILLIRRKNRKRLVLGSDWFLAVAGGVVLTINLCLWCTALNYVPVANVTLLDNTAPLWVGLFGWMFLRHRTGRAYWIGLATALAGAAIMLGFGDGQKGAFILPGNLLGVLCGLTYGSYQLITARVREKMDSLSYTWLMAAIATCLLLPVVFFSGQFGYPLAERSYILLFLMALTSQVIGYYLINHALGHLPTGAASVSLIGQPVIATALGALLIGEVPSLVKILGGILCLIGIFIVNLYAAPVVTPVVD